MSPSMSCTCAILLLVHYGGNFVHIKHITLSIDCTQYVVENNTIIKYSFTGSCTPESCVTLCWQIKEAACTKEDSALSENLCLNRAGVKHALTGCEWYN